MKDRFFALAGELIGVQVTVMPSPAQQRAVIAVFNDPSAVDDPNPAGGFDR